MIHRFTFPPSARREKVVHLLTMAYDTEDFEHVHEAARIVTDYYKLKPVKIGRRRKFKPRTLAGLCWEDGRIELLCPSVWKREHRPRAKWIATALHEFGHYVFWVDGEKKADDFARRMMS